jgi:hypothetical protein
VVVSPRRVPSQEEAGQAIDRLLVAVAAGEDIFDALDEIRSLHPKNNTFPGEAFIRLAADALDQGGASRASPFSEEGFVDRYLPECEFRARDNRKIRYAVLAAAATHGGVEVDLLAEVAYWATDDFWSYAGLAAVAWIRAVADQRGIVLSELCGQLSSGRGPRR